MPRPRKKASDGSFMPPCGSLDIHIRLNNKRAKVKAVRVWEDGGGVSQRLTEEQEATRWTRQGTIS